MKLALQHTDHSPYVRCGIFIKHASPKVWLEEITRMQLKLSECTIYSCPGEKANSISGALIIFKTAQKRVEVYNNLCVQKVQNGFYIPENTQLNMALTQEEYAKILQGKPHFFHHQYGFIELKEEVQWENLLQAPKEQFPKIESPAKGVQIPMKVTAFSVEIEEEETESTLGNPFGDEKVDPEDLPFDMKKVLEGNNREVEKYLKYLERNPEAALKMAIPLDMLGTSRGKAFAKYKFKSNFFDAIGFGNTSPQTKSTIKTVVGMLAIIAVFWIGYYAINEMKKQPIEVVKGEVRYTGTGSEDLLDEGEVVIETNNTGNTGSGTFPKNVNNTDNGNNSITNTDAKEAPPSAVSMLVFSVVVALVLVIVLIALGYYIMSRRDKKVAAKNAINAKNNNNNKSSSWMDLPEENELFSFKDEEETRGSNFYFGGNELTFKSKMLIVIMLVALLVYLFYPMINSSGIEGIFIFFAGFIVIRLLYALINKNKNIIND